MGFVEAFYLLLRACVISRASLTAENLALRRELLDHVIVRNEAHLRRLITSYLESYHTVRPHLSLEHNAPIPRPMQVPSAGKVVAMPCVGGLHHGYRRVA